MNTVDITCVDPDATHYGTFQSHNEKVLSNRRGIFMTHIRSRDAAYRAQTWRLSRSTDGGLTFSTLYEATHATNPPVIVTDEGDNIYLMRVDFLDWHARLYRFMAEKEYRDPEITEIRYATGDKYAMVYDDANQQIYYLPRNRSFHVLGRDGAIRRSYYELFKDGPAANLQYPHMRLDRDGTLHVAWTSNRHDVYLYWDIHHMLSRDCGQTWQNMDGSPVAPPIVADHTSAALRITPDDEFDVHTWLANFLPKDGKVHFVYRAGTEPWRMHYMRYDVAAGRRDVHYLHDVSRAEAHDRRDAERSRRPAPLHQQSQRPIPGDGGLSASTAAVSPGFQGESIRFDGFDGFFATRPEEPGSPLFCVMSDSGYIACLVSHDNGETWHDHARSDRKYESYSIGGCGRVTDEGYIIGSFTDQTGLGHETTSPGRVMFFRIRA